MHAILDCQFELLQSQKSQAVRGLLLVLATYFGVQPAMDQEQSINKCFHSLSPFDDLPIEPTTMQPYWGYWTTLGWLDAVRHRSCRGKTATRGTRPAVAKLATSAIDCQFNFIRLSIVTAYHRLLLPISDSPNLRARLNSNSLSDLPIGVPVSGPGPPRRSDAACEIPPLRLKHVDARTATDIRSDVKLWEYRKP